MDLGASRRGTDMGPSALRIAGLGRELRKLGHQVDREADVAVPAMETRADQSGQTRFKEEILAVCEALATKVEEVLDAGARPLVLGGDHSIAMGTVAGASAHFRKHQQNLGLIWIDAHGDMNIPSSTPSGNIHGMPLAHILGQGDEELVQLHGFAPKVRPENVALIGIRDVDGQEKERIRESGIHVYTMREIDERGMGEVAREVIGFVTNGTAGCHVSFDVDGLDPGVAPGVGTPVPGGINYREAHLLLELIHDSEAMASMEVVELNPMLDDRNISAERVMHLVLSAFGMTIL